MRPETSRKRDDQRLEAPWRASPTCNHNIYHHDGLHLKRFAEKLVRPSSRRGKATTDDSSVVADDANERTRLM
jgi:hypothetical protein